MGTDPAAAVRDLIAVLRDGLATLEQAVTDYFKVGLDSDAQGSAPAEQATPEQQSSAAAEDTVESAPAASDTGTNCGQLDIVAPALVDEPAADVSPTVETLTSDTGVEVAAPSTEGL